MDRILGGCVSPVSCFIVIFLFQGVTAWKKVKQHWLNCFYCKPPWILGERQCIHFFLNEWIGNGRVKEIIVAQAPLHIHTHTQPFPTLTATCSFIYNIYIYIFTQEQGLYSNCWGDPKRKVTHTEQMPDRPTNPRRELWDGKHFRGMADSLHSLGLDTPQSVAIVRVDFHMMGEMQLGAAGHDECSGIFRQLMPKLLTYDIKALYMWKVCMDVCDMGCINPKQVVPLIQALLW